MLILQFLFAIMIAFAVGKLIAKLRLPSILGWLITGIVLGPHALSLIDSELIGRSWYQITIHILECAVGLMIGTELVWGKIRSYGKALIITTVTHSLGTFAVEFPGILSYFFNGGNSRLPCLHLWRYCACHSACTGTFHRK